MLYFQSNTKFLREKSGLSQAKIAASVDVGRSTWTGYESGFSQPNISGLLKIAEFFDITISDLLEKDLSIVDVNTKSSIIDKLQNVEVNVDGNVDPSSNNEVNEGSVGYNKPPLNPDKIDYKDALISSQAALIEQLQINIKLQQNQKEQLIIETEEKKEKYSAPKKERKTA